MEKIGFIGAFDKTDLVMYVAKILVEAKKKVLLIDATVTQKAKYVVPTIEDKTAYVTSFADIDIAVGFENYSEIKQYLGMPESAVFTYDYIFIDVDNPRLLENFDVYEAKKLYFVTSMDAYSLRRGLEVLSEAQATLSVEKVYFSNMMSKEEDDYLNFLSRDFYRIKWKQDIIYFPHETSDQDRIMENQRVAKIRFKGLSTGYRDSLVYLAQDVCGNQNAVRKAYKQIERGV